MGLRGASPQLLRRHWPPRRLRLLQRQLPRLGEAMVMFPQLHLARRGIKKRNSLKRIAYASGCGAGACLNLDCQGQC